MRPPAVRPRAHPAGRPYPASSLCCSPFYYASGVAVFSNTTQGQELERAINGGWQACAGCPGGQGAGDEGTTAGWCSPGGATGQRCSRVPPARALHARAPADPPLRWLAPLRRRRPAFWPDAVHSEGLLHERLPRPGGWVRSRGPSCAPRPGCLPCPGRQAACVLDHAAAPPPFMQLTPKPTIVETSDQDFAEAREAVSSGRCLPRCDSDGGPRPPLSRSACWGGVWRVRAAAAARCTPHAHGQAHLAGPCLTLHLALTSRCVTP